MSGTAPSTFRIYLRAPRLLASERGRAALPAAAGIAVALMQLAGPVLFGRGIDAPAQGRGAFGVIALWAALGLFGIAASVLVAAASDRLAHRRRLAAPAEAFARAITPSVSYHWERGTGAVVRAILAGTDTLFGQWPPFFRHQLTAVVSIMFLIPTAIGMDPRMASILAVLALLHLGINVLVVRRTSAGQEAVERHHGGVYGRVGDVPGNVTVVRSYVRGSAELEATRAVIGARGAALSGGERQRLAIARAILKDAPILILDEATSALDAETEAKIKRALDASRRGRTTLIIAHRLSTVADADRILVMERGTFREPAAGGGLFARLGAEGGFTEPTAPGGA